ncbi:uncharacterized protein LOC144884664 [Branchiostoma floridae x Branchiostoma japonicum]
MSSNQVPPGYIASQRADGTQQGSPGTLPAAPAPGNGQNQPIAPSAHGPPATSEVPGDHTYHAHGGSPHDLAGTELLSVGSQIFQDPAFVQGLQQMVAEAVSGSMRAFTDRNSRSRSRFSSFSSGSGSEDEDDARYRRHRRHERSRSPLHRQRDDVSRYSSRSRSRSRSHRPTSPSASQVRDDISVLAPSESELHERERNLEVEQELIPDQKEEEVTTSPPPDPYDLLTSIEPKETGVLVSDKLLNWFKNERCLLFSQQTFDTTVKPYLLDQSQLEAVSAPNLQPLLREKWEGIKHSVQAVKHDDSIKKIQEHVLRAVQPLLVSLDTIVPLTVSDNKELSELANTLVTNLKVTGQLLGSVCNEITGVRRRLVHEWVDPRFKCLVHDKQKVPGKSQNVDGRLTNATCKWLLGEDIIKNIEDCEKTEKTVARLNSSGFAANKPPLLYNKPASPKTQQSSGLKELPQGEAPGKKLEVTPHPSLVVSPRSPPALQPLTQVAGRLQHFLPQWQAITSDAWVLQAIQGLKPQLTGRPIQRVAPREQNRSTEETDLISKEIQSLLQKGAITEVLPTPGEFVASLFLVPKKSGGWRPVVNLKPLNQYVLAPHFKMEGLQDLKSLIRPGDWMASLDIQDAYFHIPIHPSFRKLLRFQFQSRLWEFQVCPFGLNCIPRAFTKITKPIIAVIRSQGIRIIIYLDDILILGTSAQECRDNLKFVIDLLTSLGFLLNWEKSQLIPTQKITFLGMVIDSLLLTFSLPEEKVMNLVQTCSSLQGSQQISLRQLARVLGKMTASVLAVLPAPLYYRALQTLLNDSRTQGLSWEDKVTLPQEARQELLVWSQCLSQWNGKVFVNPQGPILTITSDASLQGWGATCENNQTGGRWSLSESKLHINELELKAAFFALQCFAATRKNIHVHLRIDNTSAVAYINHQGGCKSLTLCKTALNLWKWSLARGLTISAEHIPGVQNEEADTASRVFQDTTEWSLHPDLFRLASRQLNFHPEVDLFASRLNTKLPKFCSWKPDPLAWKVDAFTWPWNGMKVYIFPPVCLLSRCLAKVRQDKAQAMVIAPFWPSQPWFPLLKELATDEPFPLPVDKYSLSLPGSRTETHPLWKTLKLTAWAVSGRR